MKKENCIYGKILLILEEKDVTCYEKYGADGTDAKTVAAHLIAESAVPGEPIKGDLIKALIAAAQNGSINVLACAKAIAALDGGEAVEAAIDAAADEGDETGEENLTDLAEELEALALEEPEEKEQPEPEKPKEEEEPEAPKEEAPEPKEEEPEAPKEKE